MEKTRNRNFIPVLNTEPSIGELSQCSSQVWNTPRKQPKFMKSVQNSNSKKIMIASRCSPLIENHPFELQNSEESSLEMHDE